MALPFFGKKQSDNGKAGDSTRPGDEKSGLDLTTSLEFTHMGSGDVNRSLAAAAGKIQVVEASVDEVAAIEEAAVLYANANESGAKAVLEETIAGSGKRSEQLWRMLFDLYRLMGDKASFDSQGVVFAQLFEKSPPVWDILSTAPETTAAVKDKAPTVNLSGILGANAQNQFDQLMRIGSKAGKLRIDLSKLRSIDAAGCNLLCEALETLKRSKVKVALLGVAHTLTLLEPNLKVGEAKGRSFWQVTLTLMQQLGDQDRFEEAAINFAITFEESPPSWDPPDESLTATDSLDLHKLEEAPDNTRDSFTMEGFIGGSQPEILQALAGYASERDFIEIDATHLRRLEFVSAGSLFNQLAQFQGQGKHIIVYHPNEMVAALMTVMGIDQIARLNHKKF
jgi:anti-anti-sigma regulatory factor